MAKVILKHIYKVYDGKVKAVNDFDLEVEDKEFVVFVGPSGCGKSTTLRMVAGLEDITAGELWIGDKLCNHVEPKNRNISMVFQNYALFPNMSVYDNIAFGLRMRRISDVRRAKDGQPVHGKDGNPIKIMRRHTRKEIDAKVKWAAEILGITEYLDRRPKALSGGQRQRVALGRAIVREPSVFLFDEPLSNLDAKLRAKMRTEITKLHKRLQTTFIYVTHDQVEAMTMGDRIVVMKDGYIQQTDTPQNLFRWPANKFVAGFIGTPQMNFFTVTLKREDGGSVTVSGAGFSFKIPEEQTFCLDESYLDGSREVYLGVRPDDIRPLAGEPDGAAIRAYVALVEELGTQTLFYANINEAEAMREDSPTAFCASAGENCGVAPEQYAFFAVDTSKLHFFDMTTEVSIKHRMSDTVVKVCVANGELSLFGAKYPLPPALSDKLPQGQLTARIPPSALAFSDDGVSAVVESCEEFHAGIYACRVSCGGCRLFLHSEGPVAIGSDAKISVAFEKITFSADGGVVAAAVPDSFRFPGRYIRAKKGAARRHYIEIDGVMTETPDDFNHKMYDRGRGIFKMQLAFETNTADISVSADGTGIPVSVDSVADYGKNRYAFVHINECSFAVPVGKEFCSDTMYANLNFSRVRVYDGSIDMRLF